MNYGNLQRDGYGRQGRDLPADRTHRRRSVVISLYNCFAWQAFWGGLPCFGGQELATHGLDGDEILLMHRVCLSAAWQQAWQGEKNH